MFSGLLLSTIMLVGTPLENDTTIYTSKDLDEITVVEFKRNQRDLTPHSSTTLGKNLIDRQQITSMEQLSANIPNMYMPEYGSRQTTPVFLRGVGQKSKGNAVGFYVDGVPHFENTSFNMDFSDIDNIEVLRGPQGTLYGRDAIAGIINVHTRSPFDYQKTHLKVGYGSHNDITAHASNYSKLGERFALHVSGTYYHSDGFFRNITIGKKSDKMDDTYLRGALYWKPSNEWTLRLSTDFNYSDQDGYPYSVYNLETEEADPISYNRPSGYWRLMSINGFNARYENSNVSFNSQTSFEFIKDRQHLDQDFTSADRIYVESPNYNRIFSQEFTLKSNNESRYQWIVGAFGMAQNYDHYSTIGYLANGFDKEIDYSDPVYSFAFYHQSSYNIWRGLSATIGLRYDWEYNHRDYVTYQKAYADGAISAQGGFSDGEHFQQLTPKFALQYKTTHGNYYYASVSRGYEGGGYNSIPDADGNYTYEPSFNWNYEVGTKVHTLDDRFSAELTLFYIDWRHQQISQVVPGVGTLKTNAGRSRNLGLESTINVRPIRNLNLNVSYGLTYATFTDYKKSETDDYTGKKLPFVPGNTLAVNADYNIYPSGNTIDRITLSAGLSGVGKVYWFEDNTAGQDFYALLNASATIEKGIFAFRLWGKNLTDTNYLSYGFKSGPFYVQQGRPLAFGASVEMKF